MRESVVSVVDALAIISLLPSLSCGGIFALYLGCSVLVLGLPLLSLGVCFVQLVLVSSLSVSPLEPASSVGPLCPLCLGSVLWSPGCSFPGKRVVSKLAVGKNLGPGG